MKIIVGLGNPGEKYDQTRHNLGFAVLDQMLKDYAPVDRTVWQDEAKFKSDIASSVWKSEVNGEEKIILMKPKTYMNNSGMAVQLAAEFYKVSAEDIWVVHDELDLPLGTLKIRLGGAAAGHHGVEDIMEKLGTDKFWRFRLGISHMRIQKQSDDERGHSVGRMKMNGVDEFVLGRFEGKDHTEAKKMVKHTADAIEIAITKGLKVAQNRFNTK